jgi:hypothetical protein
MENGLAHLLPESVPLECPAQPRAGVDGTQHGEALGHHALHADHLAVDEDAAAVRPLLGRPFGPLSPPELGRLASPEGCGGVGKGRGERHGDGIVNPLIDQRDERAELVLPG